MGTARIAKGPGPEKPERRSKDSQSEYAFLCRRRTTEQVGSICQSAELGRAVAETCEWLYLNQKWLRGSTYFKRPVPSIPKDGLPPFFPLFTPTLSPAASLASHGRQVFETFQQLLHLAEQLRTLNQSLFEKHPWIDDHLRRWQSVLKLTCAFAMYAVEAENMKEPLSPREMEAVALVIALRPPEQEFERDEKTPAQRKENWKKLMKEARKDVLPLLRQLAAEHRSAVQDAMPPSGPPVQPAVSALSTPTEPPEQPTTTSPEQSGAAGGDKR